MRAIKLSITAFGPYLNKQVINFEELGDESIFLITGPTGAGKTTVFDAICYALYGRASGSDRDQDSLRSHFATIDEPTEVEFRFVLNNREYEIIRSPKQQKKKERGDGFTEEPAKAILYEIIDGEKQLISSRIKDVNESIEERLGFDYEQFRKMVLIPQGEFRKLISENSREREAILQKIFRTYFYERITEELKVQSKNMESEIRKLESDINYEFSKVDWQQEAPEEMDTDEVLFEKLEKEQEQTKELVNKQTEIKTNHQKKAKATEERLHKAKLIEEKIIEQEVLTKELENLEVNKELITQKKEKLQRAQIAQQIVPIEEQSIARKSEWHKQQDRLNKLKELIQTLELNYNTLSVEYKEKESKEHEREKLKEEIKIARQQYDQINEFLQLKQSLLSIEKQKEQELDKQTQVDNQIKTLDKTLQELELKLSEENQLTKQFYETKEQLNKQLEIKKKMDQLAIENNKLHAFRQEYTKIHRRYQEKQAEIKKLKMKYDSLESQQKQQFASLLAHQLVEGEPCPVCGSIEHPNKAAHSSLNDDIKELDQLKEIIHKEEAGFEKLQGEFVEHTSKGQTQRSVVDSLQNELKEILPDWNETVNSDSLANVEFQMDGLNQVICDIKEKLDRIEEYKKQREQFKGKHNDFKQTFDLISNSLQQTQEKLVKTATKIEELAKHMPKEVDNPDTFKQLLDEKEASYNQMITEWEQLKTNFESAHERIQKELTVLEQVQEFEKETKKNYEGQQERLITKLYECGFTSSEDYGEAKLEIEEQKQLENEIQEYENRYKQIRFRLEELKTQLDQAERMDIKTLEEELTVYQNELQQMEEQLFTLQSKLKHDTNIATNLTKIMDKLKELNNEYYIIGSLADLAGGNNPLRLSFERYVLASFLDEILLQANLRLDKMTEHRYQLIRSGEVAKRGAQSGLDLEVMDHHTGITRSVKTLSGGEGFKAALSLALGLADVVQAHAGGVQLDTLFIDEGFGTLDEVSLQQAIDCLKDLQESNRLLGIISHVGQLKNEIHTKLVITPTHKGSNLAFSFGK